MTGFGGKPRASWVWRVIHSESGRATGQSTAARLSDWPGRLSIRAGPSRRTESRRPCYRRFSREAVARGAAVACPAPFGRIGDCFRLRCPTPPVSASGSSSFVAWVTRGRWHHGRGVPSGARRSVACSYRYAATVSCQVVPRPAAARIAAAARPDGWPTRAVGQPNPTGETGVRPRAPGSGRRRSARARRDTEPERRQRLSWSRRPSACCRRDRGRRTAAGRGRPCG